VFSSWLQCPLSPLPSEVQQEQIRVSTRRSEGQHSGGGPPGLQQKLQPRLLDTVMSMPSWSGAGRGLRSFLPHGRD
jgi:hypothetical protein